MNEEITCPDCDGMGTTQKTYNKGQQFVDVDCQRCGGSGYIFNADDEEEV